MNWRLMPTNWFATKSLNNVKKHNNRKIAQFFLYFDQIVVLPYDRNLFELFCDLTNRQQITNFSLDNFKILLLVFKLCWLLYAFYSWHFYRIFDSVLTNWKQNYYVSYGNEWYFTLQIYWPFSIKNCEFSWESKCRKILRPLFEIHMLVVQKDLKCNFPFSIEFYDKNNFI